MKTDIEIKELLDRFMEGKTSVEEEIELERCVRETGDEDIPEGITPEDWQTYKAMFTYFDEDEESGEKEPAIRPHASRKKLFVWSALSIAASVCLFLLIGVRENPPSPQELPVAQAQPADIAKDSTRQADTVITRKKSTHPHPVSNTGKVKKVYFEPSAPRNYMAEETPERTDSELDQAKEQADMLLRAIYIQQELDLQAINEMTNGQNESNESAAIEYEPY